MSSLTDSIQDVLLKEAADKKRVAAKQAMSKGLSKVLSELSKVESAFKQIRKEVVTLSRNPLKNDDITGAVSPFSSVKEILTGLGELTDVADINFVPSSKDIKKLLQLLSKAPR